MDEIIKKIKEKKGYVIGDTETQIMCYADDAIIMAKSEDDLQFEETETNCET